MVEYSVQSIFFKKENQLGYEIIIYNIEKMTRIIIIIITKDKKQQKERNKYGKQRKFY